MKKFIIIDGNALVHRAFHAIPPMTNKEGKMLNAVYGFTSILLRIFKELEPTYLAVTFDLAAQTFRHKEYKEYKAQRAKQPEELYAQMTEIKELLRAMQISIYEKEGYEADDLIATLATKVDGTVEKIIATGDMDTLQLVNEHTKIYTLKKGVADIAIYDIKAVIDRYGLKPEQMIDYKALRGDPSDNIVGVKGIGEKNAAELLKHFGTLENLFEQLESGKSDKIFKISDSVKKKLIDGKKEAMFSKHLVVLVKDVLFQFELKDCLVGNYNTDAARELLTKWEFGSLLKRLNASSGNVVEEVAKESSTKKKVTLVEIKKAEEIEKLNKELSSAKNISLFLSDDNENGLKAKLFGMALNIENEKSYYAPGGLVKKIKIKEGQMIFGHDLKRNLEILKRNDFKAQGLLMDIMIMDYLLDPGTRSHDLKNLELRYLEKTLPETDQASLFGVDSKTIVERANDIFLIGEKLVAELKNKGFLNLYEKLEEPLIKVLQEMEEAGIKVDVDYLKVLSEKIHKQIKSVEEKIYKEAGEEFNIASPQQVKNILFDKLEISVKGIRKGKTGLSTAASELEKMRGMHPIIDLIFEYRELAKLQNTYVDVLPTLIFADDKRIHTTYNQAVTSTGRLSSSNPNLQNIPIKSELGAETRKCFVAEKGYKLLSLDYSQIELRVVASLSNDAGMIKAFKDNQDIHTITAAKVQGISEAEVTKAMRSAAKAINFGIIYGIGPQGLAEGAGISFYEAKEFIAKYFEAFPDVKKYLDETRALAHSLGYVETLLGRRRYLPDLASHMVQVKNAAERMAINAPVQGTAADLLKMAMIKVADTLKDEKENIKMLLQVHDELVFEVKENMVEKFAEIVNKIMENVIKLRVPIKVDAKVGNNWGEMEKI